MKQGISLTPSTDGNESTTAAYHTDNVTSSQGSAYTCREYREEMILLSLQRQLAAPGVTDEKKARLKEEIAAVSARMGI